MLHGMDGTALFQVPEMTVSGLYAKKTPRRFCRTDNHLGKGKHDADQNTIDGSKQQHSKKCTKKDQTFRAADFPQTDCKFKFRGSKQCGDHNRGKHRNRKKSFSKEHHELRREIEMRIDPDEEDPELYQYEDFEKEEKEDGSFASQFLRNSKLP